MTTPGAQPRIRTFQSLSHEGWRTLWLAGHLWHIAFWMDLFILGWIVLVLTDSPLMVSLVGTFRLLPLGILGFLAGVQADRFPKRRLLFIAQTINLIVTMVFVGLLALDAVRVWHVFVAALLTGSAWAIDFPVRRAFIRELLPESAMVNAMALDAASLTGTAMVGRWLAGGLLALLGAAGAYSFLLGCYLLGFILLLRVPEIPSLRDSGYRAGSIVGDLREGLKYVWRIRALRGIFLVTVFINLLTFP
ncbi:MAG: MFS transporter, partial [Planctomycetes bacterium]|nr:MFS transporter [Planctomycetota bacterium]